MNVKILMGLPGSGKTTWIEENYPLEKTMICSADHYFQQDGKYQFDASKLGEAHGDCLRTFTEAVTNPETIKSYGVNAIIVDNTNLTWLEMAPYVALSLAYDFKVEIIFFDADKYDCIDRNTHNVPEKSIHMMAIALSKTLDARMPRHWENDCTFTRRS